MALPASAPDTGPRSEHRRAFDLGGALVVSHSQESATRHLVRACVSGALGPGLRVVHRDAEVIRFRAATLGAWLLGPGRATLAVSRVGAQTVVTYAASVWGVLGLSAAVGVGAGIVVFEGLAGVSRPGSTLLLAGAGLAAGLGVAVGLGAALTHHIRVRFETLLHNLRYLS